MKRIFTILLLLVSSLSFSQQSAQYSQYSFNNFGYNPAFAGTTECLDFRAGTRYQWLGFEGAPESQFASFHTAVGKSRHYKNKGKHAIGVYLEQDRVHLTNRFYGKAAYAYHKRISQKYTMGAGVYVGFQRYSVDAQFNSTNPDPVLANASGSTFRYPDIMPGILLYSKKTYWSFAINQLYFKKIGLGVDQTQVNQYYLGFGHKSSLNHGWDLFKSMLIKWNVMGPPAIDLNMTWVYYNTISFGLGYRVGDAIVAQMKFKFWDKFSIGYAYDYTLSNFRGSNSHELVIGLSPCGGGGVGSDGIGEKYFCPAYN